MATTVFPEAGDQITEAAWTSANKTIAVATEYRVNGYLLSAGTGLNVDISAGTCFVNGYEVVSDGTQIEAVSPNSINYVYLNDDGTLTVNTSGTQPSNSLFIGTATTDGSGVTAVSHKKSIANDYNVGIIKSADESVSSSTTLQNDDELVWTAEAGSTWDVVLALRTTDGGGGISFDFVGFDSGDPYSFAGPAATDGFTYAVVGTPYSSASVGDFLVRGILTTTTGGTVGLKWAQNSSNAAASTVQQNSWIYARRLLG